MKAEIKGNPNYAARIVRVETLTEFDNCDNVVGMPYAGMQAIVGKDTKVGDLGVLFVTESVLSDTYLMANNLYRHAEKNANPEHTGYIEDSRRVKALKFRGHQSDCFFMPLDSLWPIVGKKRLELKEGETFDTLDGVEVCAKYERPVRYVRTPGQVVLEKRVEKKLFPVQEHVNHFLRELRYLDLSAPVVITQKLHGTNLRVANTLTRRTLSWRDRLAHRFRVPVHMSEYAIVYGSHLVVKGVDNPSGYHFYGEDIWSHYGAELAAFVPQGYIVYAELVGYTPTGTPIQQRYTYEAKARSADVYVYRVAHVNPQGIVCDLSWEAVKEFCRDRGIQHVPELWRGEVQEVPQFLETYLGSKFIEHFSNAVRCSEDSPCDEGVVVRLEAFHPTLLKAKAPEFVLHESKQIDAGVVDIEEEESRADPGE